MAQNKREEFDKDLLATAEFARVLSHPARLAILQAVASRSGCICGEIVDLLPLAQSTVSQHLKVLKESGLIKGEVEGPKSCYCIDWDKLKVNSDRFKKLIDSLPIPQDTQCC
jgi:DNA-binding transcriptional ArsR family regulator